MFMGEYSNNIDEKGRLVIPSKFRAMLGEEFVITRGLDGCIFGYPVLEWKKFEAKLKELPVANKKTREFVRFFYSAATECGFDKSGRVSIPTALREHGDLRRECIIVGVGGRIEIWNKDEWQKNTLAAEDDFESIADAMSDFGF
ncbi:MAG: division/cell wall cluster transcriptional repressor MraZ [Lactobacillales bacterium]|jgi:MraZ protein|nr:division/cell wall cluster transcriptional repressor MraZ [Lactobacillales bacterium]